MVKNSPRGFLFQAGGEAVRFKGAFYPQMTLINTDLKNEGADAIVFLSSYS
jgi:hypothetical protein